MSIFSKTRQYSDTKSVFSEPIIIAAIIGGLFVLAGNYGLPLLERQLSSSKAFPRAISSSSASYLMAGLYDYVFVVASDGVVMWANERAKQAFNLRNEILSKKTHSLREVLRTSESDSVIPAVLAEELASIVDKRPKHKSLAYFLGDIAWRWDVTAIEKDQTTLYYLIQGMKIDQQQAQKNNP